MNALAFTHLMLSVEARLIHGTALTAALFSSKEKADFAEDQCQIYHLLYLRADNYTLVTKALQEAQQ